jgi:hypothetical protein
MVLHLNRCKQCNDSMGIKMALSSKERTAKHRAIKSATEFSKTYLNGEIRVTPEEFIQAKVDEAQSQIIGLVTGFELSVTNPFYSGLQDLDKDEDHYAVSDMFILWKEIVDELKENDGDTADVDLVDYH